MRKPLTLLVIVLSLIVSSSFFLHQSQANDSPVLKISGQGEDLPGSRCTRFTYGPKTKAKIKLPPNTRCSRLYSSPGKGVLLPNTAPKGKIYTLVDQLVLLSKSSEDSTSLTSSNRKLKLKTVASDPEGDTMLYTYTATAGKIEGSATLAQALTGEVSWDLSKEKPGTYMVTVEIDDGCGCMSSASASVTVAACSDCKEDD